LLEELGCEGSPIINVLNKCDKLNEPQVSFNLDNSVQISAKTGKGIDRLLELIDENLPVRIKKVKMVLPFSMAGAGNEIRTKATLISENYTNEGIEIQAIIDEEMYRKFREYIIDTL
jgi:GTP-binding protein HflX